MKILLTGCAGFIGYHLSKKLLKNNNYVLGIDNLDPYYDLKLKNHRIKDLKKNKKFEYYKFDLNNKKKLKTITSRWPKSIQEGPEFKMPTN